MGLKVHKFGGSSLANADCFRRVASIVSERIDDDLIVVVSAMGGMTDQLLGTVTTAAAGNDPSVAIAAIRERYLAAVGELIDDPERAAELESAQARDIDDIENVLKALALVHAASHRSEGLVAGFGEVWSARLLAAVLAADPRVTVPVRFVNAREALIIEHGEMGPAVHWEQSAAATENLLGKPHRGIAVVTGFIASDAQGLPTTLGRNGSDYSASIFAALLGSTEISIWTDVDGVMSGDPRLVPEAKVIDQISYNEAMELAYFGAKVIHPQTMAPAVAHDIPIRILNTFAPDGQGTTIDSRSEPVAEIVKGVSAVRGVALINLEGAGMIGVPGTADRLFGALREAGISVMMISQGSSEHSICFAVREADAALVRRVVERAFAAELGEGLVQRVEVTGECAILAIVGDGMSGVPGSAGRFFRTLGSAGINVRAIAQGASERNISAVIRAQDITRALRAVHSSFYLSSKTISIGLVGPGAVGSALLAQISAAAPRLRSTFNVDLRVRAIASSRRMLLAPSRIDLAGWRESLQAGTEVSLEDLADHVQTDYLPHSVIIDCTASETVAGRYRDWLARGIHVITPNKRAYSGPAEGYRDIRSLTRTGTTHFLYEATVGAGLPVITTLKDLVETGDEIVSISGIFSGTLAYLFNVFDGSVPFSTIVREARSKGYTEPDPRDDLSGTDVARKAVILARESGLALELGDVSVESLVPAALCEAEVEAFLDGLANFDAPMAERYSSAQARGRVLRYVAEVDVVAGSASVGLVELERSHPFASIALTDNIVQFVTRRYSDNPLIVRGPGAGPDVTAAGIFADLLRLSSMLTGSDD